MHIQISPKLFLSTMSTLALPLLLYQVPIPLLLYLAPASDTSSSSSSTKYSATSSISWPAWTSVLMSASFDQATPTLCFHPDSSVSNGVLSVCIPVWAGETILWYLFWFCWTACSAYSCIGACTFTHCNYTSVPTLFPFRATWYLSPCLALHWLTIPPNDQARIAFPSLWWHRAVVVPQLCYCIPLQGE